MKLARWQRWLLVILLVGGALWCYERWRVWHENSQDDVILAAARKYGVDPALIKAVVWKESRFNPKARGRRGEVGLMQIMESTAQDWAKAERRPFWMQAEMFDRRKNTECGAWCLRRALARYSHTDNPIPYALAEYNAGRANVLKWMTGPAATNSAIFIAQIGFPATQDYVVSTMRRHEHYRRSWRPAAGRQEPLAP